VGCPGGVEIVGHSLRDCLRRNKDSELALLKIDFKNAFNLLDRDSFVKASSTTFPAMESWTRWCYSEPPLLIYDHSRTFRSRAGVQQGDPLGPLYFCCGLQFLVDRIAEQNPVYQKWYMDDGGIIGNKELLLKVWEVLRVEGADVGLQLNPDKCEWSWLNPNCAEPCPIERVALVKTSEIQILGVPLGSDEWVAAYVQRELLPATEKAMRKLVKFEDSQVAMYLLRLSYSIVRANHFMRTTPLSQWQDQATVFDKLIRDSTELILGLRLPEAAYDQACVSTRSGGFGIRRARDHAPLAYAASFKSSKAYCQEDWTIPPDIPNPDAARYSQHLASCELDKVTMDRLKAAAATQRERQRLKRLDAKHANSWITAFPSALDGRDTIMEPKVFRVAVARLLGLPLLKESLSCPLCMQIMDIYGDHALCCKKIGDTITRHNKLRNWVYKLAEQGLQNPEMEKLGILGATDSTKRRPGDVSIPLWRYGRGMAIDVAVICPLAASHVDSAEPCEEYARLHKHNRYDASFVNSRYDFVAMVFETSGAVNEEGENIMKQLIRFAAKRLGVGNSIFAGRAWARVSCSIQAAVAQAILNREHVGENEEEEA